MKTFLFAAWISGCGADAASTHVALNRGAHELILTQHPYVNDAIIAGEATVGVYGLRRLYKTHPRVALVLGIGAGVFRNAVAAHNLRASR